jgi:transcription initiation factor TFIIIB Brf1 subunit/transcription initiation factor TFIIB
VIDTLRFESDNDLAVGVKRGRVESTLLVYVEVRDHLGDRRVRVPEEHPLEIPTADFDREDVEARLLRGRSIEAVGAAAVYATCRINGLPRTEAEVAEAARCSARAFRNAYHALNRELELPAAVQRPARYIPQFASELGVPEHVWVRAVDIATRAADLGLSNGQRPSGFAAACLLVAAEREAFAVTQKEVAAVAGVSAMTVRKQRNRVRARL